MTHAQATLTRIALPAGALCVCACVDPHQNGGWIFCPFRLLTGLPCPLCGMTRGISSVLRGRWAEAIGLHAFSPLAVGLAAAWIFLESGHAGGLWNAQKFRQMAQRPAPWIAFLAACFAYGALRWCGIIEGPRI